MTTSLRIGTFTSPVLLDVARTTGVLHAAGLEIIDVPVPSSPDQFRQACDGDLDAVLTNPDNVLSYRFERSNPLGELLDVRIDAAIDRGLGLTLCARDSQVLRSTRPRLGVDSPVSGFALIAYELLAARGFAREDIDIVAIGSTPRRATALIAGNCDVTILNAGNEIRALDAGAVAIASVDEVGPYIGTVLARVVPPSDAAARDSAEKADAIHALASSLLDVARAIVRGDLESETLASAERLLSLSPVQARRHRELLRDDRHGLIPSGVVDQASIRTALALRERFLPSEAVAEARHHWRESLTAPR